MCFSKRSFRCNRSFFLSFLFHTYLTKAHKVSVSLQHPCSFAYKPFRRKEHHGKSKQLPHIPAFVIFFLFKSFCTEVRVCLNIFHQGICSFRSIKFTSG